MGLNIKNPDVEARIRKLAATTGESLTQALDRAVQEKLDRLLPKRKSLEDVLARIEDLRREAGWTADTVVSDDELYDEFGLPR